MTVQRTLDPHYRPGPACCGLGERIATVRRLERDALRYGFNAEASRWRALADQLRADHRCR